MSPLKNRRQNAPCKLAFFGLLALVNAATAATLCVNPGGTQGCYKTIGTAVSAANVNDRINVGPGQYAEDVIVTKSLALVGSGPSATIINAIGLANGIYINGLDNGGLSNV